MCEKRENVLMFWISLHELKQIKTDFPLECNINTNGNLQSEFYTDRGNVRQLQ